MKNLSIIPFLLIVLIPNPSFSQLPYYDAIKLSTMMTYSSSGILDQGNDTVYKILEKYVPSSAKNDKNKIRDYFNPISFDKPDPNPFIEISGSKHGAITNSFTSIGTKGLSSIGGLDVTNIADGIAKFLVSRMKSELSAAFFNKFKETLNDKRYSDLKILFPETYKTLMTIDRDIYQYSSYMNILRENFIKDMTNQYINLQTLLKQPKYTDYFKRDQPELGSMLYSSLYIINQLSSGKHPGEVLANYNSTDLIKLCPSADPNCTKENEEKAIRASIQTIQLLSKSFRSRSISNYWVSADSVRRLVEDPIAFKIYLGLIYQENKNKLKPIDFGSGVTFMRILDSVAGNFYPVKVSIERYKDYIETFIDNAQEINEYIADLKTKKKSEIDYNDYYKLFNASLDLLDHSRTFFDLPYVEFDPTVEYKVKSISNNIIYIARTSGELYIDVRTKNYSSAIVNTISILDSLMYNNDSYTNEQFRKYLFKYGSFIANVAQAQNSEEVENAIESVALPSGSYSVKQNSKFNISLNGYIGYGYDWGNPWGLNQEGRIAREKYNLNWNVSAPIGIAISTSCLTKKNNSIGAFTAFLSIIDVGSIANFRIKDDTALMKRTITISDIFSPGLSFTYAIPKTPVAFSIGCIYKPKLLFDNNQDEFITVPGMLRWNASVLIDIPIINFKTTEH